MAGAGIEVSLDKDFQTMLNALAKASNPDKRRLLDFIGKELCDITESAFANEADPATGAKWAPLKNPRGKAASEPGSTRPILWDSGNLGLSIHRELLDDAVIVGSDKVYAAVHQYGSDTGWHGSRIPARPYLGKPADFERRLMNDPTVINLLGLAP
jgi:phage virion morphogenesis protein